MGLPYPHEVETGALTGNPPGPPEPVDITDRVSRAINAASDSSAMIAFGVRVEFPRDQIHHWVTRYRAVLSSRLLERHPNLTERTWNLFVARAREILHSTSTRGGQETLNALSSAVDGL